MLMFASALPERLMQRTGRIYEGRRLPIKTRKELLATIKPHNWRHLRPDTGDLPEGAGAGTGAPPSASKAVGLIPVRAV